MKKVSMSGNQAAAYVMKQINPDVVAIYPITPSTEIPEIFSEYVDKKLVDTEFLTMESEHSAMAACIGASLSSARSFCATSSNGLAYMYEMLHIASSMRTSVLLELVTRAISGPINIHNDHSDLYATLDTGWIVLYAKNNQQVYDLTLIGTKIAEKLNLPIIIGQDGFKTSHSIENMDILDDEDVKKFVKEFKRENNLLDKNVTFGTMDDTNYLFEHKMQQIEALDISKKEFEEISEEYLKISNRKLRKIDTYLVEDAKNVFVSIGSISDTLLDVVDNLRSMGHLVGAIDITMLRPFPKEEIREKLKNIENIIVVEKSMDYSLNSGMLKKDILASIQDDLEKNECGENTNTGRKKIYQMICCIGGRNMSNDEIQKAYLNILNNSNDLNTYYVGLRKE